MGRGRGRLSRVALVAPFAVGVAMVGAWLWWRPAAPTRTSRARRSQEADLREAEGATARSTKGASEEPETAPPVLDRGKRDQLRAIIWQAISHAAPPEVEPARRGPEYVLPDKPPWEVAPPQPREEGDAAVAAGASPGIEPKYIQERVRNEFFPLALKCYGDALEQSPELGGRIVFAFNIVGDAKTGGIVEAVDVLNESTLRDPDVIDCMRQSFLSVTFPPPASGGEVTVIYPIEFSNDDAG